MGMQQTPRRRQSPWKRYAPIIVIVVIAAIVGIVIVANRSDDKKSDSVAVNNSSTTAGAAVSGTNGIPLFYNDAKAKGEADSHKWHNCDTTTGLVAIPIDNSIPCVEEFTGDNGGATAPGVTANAIKIGYYIPRPDPVGDALLKATGSYDPPDATAKAYEAYMKLYAGVYQMWGRKVQFVRINGTGASSDPVAARADADRAAAAGVFAMLGGPGQAKQFSDELAAKKILCIGACIIAQPQAYYEKNSPYVWPVGPSPDETSSMVTEFIKKQLAGKPAQWAGGDLQGKPRTFTLLTYDTPDGQFKSSWDDLEQKTKAAGVEIKTHVDYYLNLPTLQADARTIATKLKQAGATSILFTGDPLFPKYLTAEMTKAKYFPEWVLSGTVYADTNVFARSFDQEQWKHAFGLQLIPARIPKEKQDSFTVYKWWYGKDATLPTENNYGVVKGDVELLFDGIQLAGPKLTAQTWKNGTDAAPPIVPGDKPTRQTITTYGQHGFWPGDDPAGLDNAGLLFWDPTTPGKDETGTDGVGMYRLMGGGVRYTPGHWPTEPLKLFDKTDTITIYDDNNIPPELIPKDQPVPPNAPAAG
jgi:hypothetical protein